MALRHAATERAQQVALDSGLGVPTPGSACENDGDYFSMIFTSSAIERDVVVLSKLGATSRRFSTIAIVLFLPQ